MDEDIWFYAEGARQKGPSSAHLIKALIREGKVTNKTLVWKDGMSNWTALKESELYILIYPPIVQRKTSRTPPGSPGPPPPPKKRSPGHKRVSAPSPKRNSKPNNKDWTLHKPPIGHSRGHTDAESSQNNNYIVDVTRALTVGATPPPPPSVLSSLVNGKGLVSAIETVTVYELCAFLPTLCSAIECIPFWFSQFQKQALKALEGRVRSSPNVAQALMCIFQSLSIKHISVFRSITKYLEAHMGKPYAEWDPFALNQIVVGRTRKKAKRGVSFDVSRIFHPFQPHIRLKTVTVEMIFKTNSKPVLISCDSEAKTIQKPMKMIIKFGDDFRQDVACMHVFRLLNHLWRHAKMSFNDMPIHCHEYCTIATGKNIGVVEFVENCVPLAEIHKIPLDSGKINRLVSTGAGSYIAAYILGVRDRHADNIMIRLDGTMFHIDFGRAFGDAVPMDASSFAITKAFFDSVVFSGFRDTIGADVYRSSFTDCCVRAFRELRNPETLRLVLAMVPMFFSALYSKQNIEKFLHGTLMLNKDVDTACARLRKRIESAPDSYRTMFKNTMHRLAQASKGSSSWSH